MPTMKTLAEVKEEVRCGFGKFCSDNWGGVCKGGLTCKHRVTKDSGDVNE